MSEKPAIGFALLFLSFLPAVFGQSNGFPRLEPDPRALEFYRRAPGYSWIDLAEISLWASGADNSRLAQIRSVAGAIEGSGDLPAGSRERAEYILGYMHRDLLKSYSLNQTRVDTIFVNGRYNCVSSAVLYAVLCASAGLDVSGVMTRDHAFASVRAGGESVDVETTNPYGFDPGSRREFHDQFGRLTGFAYVPARNYRDRQTIDPVALISLIFTNRISDLEKANRFADAVPLAIDRAALLAGDRLAPRADADALFGDPWQDILDRIFNYGASLLRAGREEDCLRWAALASPRYADETRWQEFRLAAVNNRIAKYARAGQNAQARAFLDGQKAALNTADYARLDAQLLDTELLADANGIRSASGGDAVIAAIAQARANSLISDRRASELLVFAVQKTAALLCAAPGRDWLAAINYIENAVSRFGSSRELEQALASYRSNRAADFHNRFAAAWNRRNFDEARRILDEGLEEFPSDRRLLADRETTNSR